MIFHCKGGLVSVSYRFEEVVTHVMLLFLFQIVDGRPIKVSEVRKRPHPPDGPSGPYGPGPRGPPRGYYAGGDRYQDDYESRYDPGYAERGRERERPPPMERRPG